MNSMEHLLFFFLALTALSAGIALVVVRRISNGVWIAGLLCALLSSMLLLLGETFLALLYLGYFGLNSLAILYFFVPALSSKKEADNDSYDVKTYWSGLVLWLPVLIILLVLFLPFAEATLLPGDFALDLLGGEPLQYLGEVISADYPLVLIGVMVLVLTTFTGAIILQRS